MVARADALKAFKTRSSTYKSALTSINDAIKNNDFAALRNSIAQAEAQQSKLQNSRIKRGGDIKDALNKEYKGGVVGSDISASVDTRAMKTTDSYQGKPRYTNNIARLQGFDSPAKLVSEAEFEMLQKANGDIFFRTVNPTEFNGVEMSSKEFASQMYTADKLDLNGTGARYYGDGIYVTTSVWNGRNSVPLSERSRKFAYDNSVCYGEDQHTVLEMTWTRTPKIIKQIDLLKIWFGMSDAEKVEFGNHSNTYACALGYDGMFCDGSVPYMVIWNRSIIAVKRQ